MSVFLFSGGISTVDDVFGGWFKQEIEDLIFFFLLLCGMSSDADRKWPHREGHECVFSLRVSSQCLDVCTTSSRGWKVLGGFFTRGIPNYVHRLVVVRRIYIMLMCSYSVLIQRMLSYNHTHSPQCIQTACSHTVDAFKKKEEEEK